MNYTNTIVISAINLVEGGTLSILKKCVQELSLNNFTEKYKIKVLVHSMDLLPKYSNIEYIAYPLSKKSWIFRIMYEYFYFYFISLKLKPCIWISLQDMTPFVITKKQYVYMHNPSPFFQKKKEGMQLSLKFQLFVLFYKYIYKINVHRNTAVIVQQYWFREKISKLCRVSKSKIIVAYPEFEKKEIFSENELRKNQFFYNAFPREFKNFEVICEAAEILSNKLPDNNWNIYLTIDGTENSYSQKVVQKFRYNSHLHFIGLISREKCEEYYQTSEVLIFPSLLETWGLPISEFKLYNKKMILSDLPYAREAANGAEKVIFFDPRDSKQLAAIMESVIRNDNSKHFTAIPKLECDEPFCSSWKELFKKIL
ncbi:glycosyltransferase [Treponema bryantii]|uniref:glycosyltransferase n=1 Tax=Treponema bryantii TaxID=163 RepID=UPI0003B576FD|nr:glycosyltransferase [Treponema bryantii]